MNSTAHACGSPVYDPVSGFLGIPCIAVFGDTRTYSANLQRAGPSDFVLVHASPDDAQDPPVTGVRVLTSPAAVAVVVGNYPNGCWSTYQKPTFERTGNTIDIRVKARVLSSPAALCIGEVVPFVEAVNLFGIGDPTQFQYTVNGVGVTPTF